MACLLPLILPGCGTTNSSGNLPDWVRDPYTRYNRQAYVAAVGNGSSRETAEKNAFGSLVSGFNMRIQVDERVSTLYQQAVRNGIIAYWSENSAVGSMISIQAGLDSLLGAEIGDVCNDNSGYYAVAVMNKANAIRIYSDLVGSNQTMISNLVDMPLAEKNTLEGYSRYQFAATVADMMVPYVNLLSVIGGPVQGFKRGDDYRLEALGIIKAIPVAIRVQNDRSNRIEGAFAKVLSDLGFQSSVNSSPASPATRYALDTNIVTSVVEFPNDVRKWTRIEVSANLVDGSTGAVLLPFNFYNREGHPASQSEADNRAYMAAEQRINEGYAKLLSDYLNQLLPKR